MFHDNIYTNPVDLKRMHKITVPVNQSICFIKIKLMDCSGTTACIFTQRLLNFFGGLADSR